MKQVYGIKIIVFVILLFMLNGLRAQQVNSMYFLDNVPVRNSLNPAFQPLGSFYLGLPVLGFSQFYVGNNSVSLKDLVYTANNQSIYFFNPNGNKQSFYNTLMPTTLLQANAQINLLDFGFKSGKSYWNFSLTEKMDGQFGIPIDIMNLILNGTPKLYNNIFNFNSLGFDASLYTEAGLGYSKKIDERWSIGIKGKFLIGSVNVSTINQTMGLNAGVDRWLLNAKGTLNYASPAVLTLGNNFETASINVPSSLADFIKPIGLGAGVDLGFTYKPNNHLTLSAALTDLGFISWTQNTKNISYNIDYKFMGLGSFNLNSNPNLQQISDSLLKDLKKSTSYIQTNNSYSTYTSPKLNIGIEYGFLENKLSLGLLSRTLKHNDYYLEELTAAFNVRPIDWFNMSLSYSVQNGRMSNIGAGLGIRTGFINWFLSADYIPLYYSSTSFGAGNNMPAVTAPIPYNTKGMNFAIGMNFVLGYRQDADHDGVVDSKDQCPETPFGVIVDKKGCPVDTDGDGVPDYLDKCPGTPPAAYNTIDENGCPLDSDGDGVPDYLDKCPDTPKEAKGFVDKNGCLLDSDNDGVPDYLDKCPNTASTAKVDKNGCPIDTDGDGVPDYLDKCPDTAKEAKGFVDASGCPIDTDGDGVPDYLDKCPTVAGLISNNGCPETKIETKKVAKNIILAEPKPTQVSNKQLKKLLQKALQGIQFETGSDVILERSFVILNQIAGVLIVNPTYIVEIRGYTDNVGKPESNKILSEKRANAVRNYLIKKKVNENRLIAIGFGDINPLASNKNSMGRALNRRVEFIVSYEEIILK